MKILKNTPLAITGSAILAAAMFLSVPTRAAAGGTDVLHLTALASMTNNGVEPDADGMVTLMQKKQGNANQQKLLIEVSGLTANTPYELMATYDTDTNVVDVETFTTDDKGEATLNFVGSGNGKNIGKKRLHLPESVDPVSLIREVGIVDTNLQAVLSADLSSPDKLQYLIKRDLSSGGVKAMLHIQATENKTQFRLLTTGLTPNTDYVLAFNGEAVQTNTSNGKGRLDIKSLADVPPYILDVRTLELLDTATNVIVSTELP